MSKLFSGMTNLLSRFKPSPTSYECLVVQSPVPEILRGGQWLVMLYLDIMDFKLTEQNYGRTHCNQVLQTLNHLVRELAPGCLKPYEFVESRLCGNGMVIYFYSPGQSPPTALEIASLVGQACERLSEKMNDSCRHFVYAPIKIKAGYSILCPGSESIEKTFCEGFKESVLAARNSLDTGEMDRRRQFGLILFQKDVRAVYQPVVSLDNGKIIGYEALLRGPENSFFNKPVNLFSYAEKTSQLFALEKLARAKALAGFGENFDNKKIFLNISPQVVNNPSFRADELSTFMAGPGAAPNQVVLEITERTSINDFRSFRESLGYYRQYGFQVAVDDAGSGYSSLQAISELQPDFIKIDISLIKDIDKFPNKRALLETFLAFSEKTGSRIIAEGIETNEELACLREIGIPLGQGFLLARPGNPLPEINPQAAGKLAGGYKMNRRDRLGRMIPVGSVTQVTATVDSSVKTREVVDFFTSYPQVGGLAILKEQRPVGLVMRDKLFNQLGSQFGFAIYNERPISLVMDNQPLIVEDDTPVEMVSQTALSRPDHKVYDSIIVSKNGIYKGLVSVRNLLDIITSMQVEAARFANPLTGLPGNRQIEEELLSRLGSGLPFSVIYSDLDYFKSFNDCYGFERGDSVINLTAGILKEISAKSGKPDDMVGHIGGDDFIIVTVPGVAEAICSGIIASFDELAPGLYDPEDRERGYIDTRDRQDQPIRLPFMTISLAMIDCRPGQYQSTEELARLAAELKKYAKSKRGSVYVKDRRSRKVS